MSLKAEIEALVATWQEEARFSREHANFNDANNPIEHTDLARLIEHLAGELSALIAESGEPQAEASETQQATMMRLEARSHANTCEELAQAMKRLNRLDLADALEKAAKFIRYFETIASQPLPPVEPEEK